MLLHFNAFFDGLSVMLLSIYVDNITFHYKFNFELKVAC